MFFGLENKYTVEELKSLIRNADSKADVCRQVGWPDNGQYRQKMEHIIILLELDKSKLFRQRYARKTKWKVESKDCPVCGTPFLCKPGHPREKKTCSHACSNKLFRSGRNNGNFKEDHELKGKIRYATICFRHHEKKCCVCGEDNIVEAHHYDENHLNNDPSNLVPLCPTHHRYVHSRYKHLVIDVVDKYVADFKESAGAEPDRCRLVEVAKTP